MATLIEPVNVRRVWFWQVRSDMGRLHCPFRVRYAWLWLSLLVRPFVNDWVFSDRSAEPHHAVVEGGY